MRPYLFALIMFSCVQAQAADFIVHVPDDLVEEGIKWESYYRGSGDAGWTPPGPKEQYFIDHCIFSESTRWILDKAIFVSTWGKVQDFKDSRITVEVKK